MDNIKWIKNCFEIRNKKIFRVSKDEIITYFTSITEASKFLVEKENLNKDCESVRKNISRALRINGKAYGYKWYYEQ